MGQFCIIRVSVSNIFHGSLEEVWICLHDLHIFIEILMQCQQSQRELGECIASGCKACGFTWNMRLITFLHWSSVFKSIFLIGVRKIHWYEHRDFYKASLKLYFLIPKFLSKILFVYCISFIVVGLTSFNAKMEIAELWTQYRWPDIAVLTPTN